MFLLILAFPLFLTQAFHFRQYTLHEARSFHQYVIYQMRSIFVRIVVSLLLAFETGYFIIPCSRKVSFGKIEIFFHTTLSKENNVDRRSGKFPLFVGCIASVRVPVLFQFPNANSVAAEFGVVFFFFTSSNFRWYNREAYLKRLQLISARVIRSQMPRRGAQKTSPILRKLQL